MNIVLAHATVCTLCTIASVLIGCQADQHINPTEQNATAVSSKAARVSAVVRQVKITQTYTKGHGCAPPKLDCFETIIVTADRPKLVDQISNLDAAISQGSTAAFFNSPASYSEIWSGVPPTILSDLQTGTGILKRVAGLPNDRREYYVVDPNGLSVNYSAVE